MAMTLEEYLETDLFLQSVARETYPPEGVNIYPNPDVLVLDNYVHRAGFVLPVPIVTVARILVIEDMAHDPIMRYPSLAAAAGYRLHRGKIFTVDGRGEVALLEFHRKEPDNAEQPQ